ncbi:S1 family peptidase [Cellulomonas sp. URHB0016]
MGVRKGWVVRVGATAAVLVGVGVPAASAVAGSTPTGAVAAATVTVDIGGKGACSGALISPWWVITATSCFAETSGAAVSAGAPKLTTTVTVGRVDLTGTAGHVVRVDRLVPHGSQDVVLARLVSPVTDVAPVKVASAAPAVGDKVTVTGYGRTATALVPDTAHAAAYTVTNVTAGTADLQASETGATICKGDAGGPTLRTTSTGVELVGIHHSAYQGGCLGQTNTLQGATDTRLDNLRSWIGRYVPRSAYNVGVWQSGAWYLKDTGAPFGYGNPTDTPLLADWDGDGLDTVGVHRGTWWYLNNQNDSSGPEHAFMYGNSGDTAIVGDWDGDGIETVGVHRGAWWYLNNQNDGSAPEYAFMYGNSGDTALVGDWDGDGIDTVGVWRGRAWYLNNQNDNSAPEYTFLYGVSSDTPVVGDWDGDGSDSVGVWRAGTWHLNNQTDSSAPEHSFAYGSPSDVPLVGVWKTK